MKPGYRTTEFWISLASQVLGILVILGVITPEQQGAVAEGLNQIIGAALMVASSFGYSLSRGIAKQKSKDEQEVK
jgi:hypothetical protein